MVKAGAFVMIITHLFPGFILGIILMINCDDTILFKTKFIFVILSAIIYIICALFVNVANEQELVTSINLLVASSVGFIFLKLSFDFLIAKKIDFKKTILLPLIMGLLSPLLSAYCMYYLHYLKFDQNILESLTWAGIYSIFPIWYSLFALNIETRQKATANIGLAKNRQTE